MQSAGSSSSLDTLDTCYFKWSFDDHTHTNNSYWLSDMMTQVSANTLFNIAENPSTKQCMNCECVLLRVSVYMHSNIACIIIILLWLLYPCFMLNLINKKICLSHFGMWLVHYHCKVCIWACNTWCPYHVCIIFTTCIQYIITTRELEYGCSSSGTRSSAWWPAIPIMGSWHSTLKRLLDHAEYELEHNNH